MVPEIPNDTELLNILVDKYRELQNLKIEKNTAWLSAIINAASDVEINMLNEARNEQIEKIDKEIKRIKHEVKKVYSDVMKVQFENRLQEFNERLERVKTLPILQMLEQEGITVIKGHIKCLWHEEKTASCSINDKTNKLHCFGCGKTADVIDTYQKLRGVPFNAAVNELDRYF